MLEITSHRNGEILNYKHGKETPDALTIQIRGIATPQSTVTVNGHTIVGVDCFENEDTVVF